MATERLPRALDKRLFGEGFVAVDGGGPYKARRPRPNSNPHGSIPDYYKRKLDAKVVEERKRVMGELCRLRQSRGGRLKKCGGCSQECALSPSQMRRGGWKMLPGGDWRCRRCPGKEGERGDGNVQRKGDAA